MWSSPSSRSARSGGDMSSSRLRICAAAVFVPVLAAAVAAPAVHAQTARLVTVVDRHAAVATTSGNVSRGRISGTVSDDRGGPLPGAMVSMLGVTMVATVADDAGHFTLEALPAGEYILRAHK